MDQIALNWYNFLNTLNAAWSYPLGSLEE